IDNDSGGDITAVGAGEGLAGGGTSGAVSLAVSFAGTGTSSAAARADHNHDAVYAPLPHTHAADWTQLMSVPPGVADGIDDDSGGDITDVRAGAGLSGGGASGAVSLAVDFAGTGFASTVARSDHNHDATYVEGNYKIETGIVTCGSAGCGSLTVPL